jgi:hypothetical protein
VLHSRSEERFSSNLFVNILHVRVCLPFIVISDENISHLFPKIEAGDVPAGCDIVQVEFKDWPNGVFDV